MRLFVIVLRQQAKQTVAAFLHCHQASYIKGTINYFLQTREKMSKCFIILAHKLQQLNSLQRELYSIGLLVFKITPEVKVNSCVLFLSYTYRHVFTPYLLFTELITCSPY